MNRLEKGMIAAAVLAGVPLSASAHPGVAGHVHGFSAGLLHPVTGLDHLLAMIAVGFFAAQRGGRALWVVPGMFLAMMTVAGFAGMFFPARLPFAEQAIAASVLVFGLLIATPARLSLTAGTAIVGWFALFHGYAHGAEMPASATGWLYGLGFLSTTAVLHLVGIGAGWSIRQTGSPAWSRYPGIAVAAGGLYLLFT